MSTATGKSAQTTVLVVLPFQMSARVFLHTDVARLLAREGDFRWVFVTRDERDAELLAGLSEECFAWREYPRPFRRASAREREHGTVSPLARLFSDVRFAIGFYLHLGLVFRFNARCGFRGFLDRLRQSRRLRRLALKEGLALSPWLGFPFPRSARLFHRLYDLYYSRWQAHRSVEAMFEQERPAAIVLGHLQTSWVTPFVIAAQRRGVPVHGVNGSWDQPTTKGPLCPGLERIAVQSRQVGEELATLHGVPETRMDVVGWPQMDVNLDTTRATPRSEFLQRLGLPALARYILVGAYSERLGSHEPAMCAELANALKAGRFGANCTLYIRPHPLDLHWHERFGLLHDPPAIVVEAPDLGDLAHLANLLRHASVLIASAGTINLDAVAVDTPSIAIAWEDESEFYYDRPARRYDMEHYAPVVASGGVRLVREACELEQVIVEYLRNPEMDAAGRARLREQCLAPLDGHSSERLVRFLVRSCTKRRAPA